MSILANSFIEAVDIEAVRHAMPRYSDLADRLIATEVALRESERRASDLYAALRTVTEHAAAAQVLLLHTGLDQPRETLERTLEEALERAAAGSMAGNIALFTAETRVDLDGRDDVTVLADARTRLQATGRRA